MAKIQIVGNTMSDKKLINIFMKDCKGRTPQEQKVYCLKRFAQIGKKIQNESWSFIIQDGEGILTNKITNAQITGATIGDFLSKL